MNPIKLYAIDHFKISVILAVVLLATSCSSEPKTNVVLPRISIPQDVEMQSLWKVEVEYQRDSSGKILYRELNRTVFVIGGEGDTILGLKTKAKEKAIRESSEEVNGVFINNKVNIRKRHIVEGEKDYYQSDMKDIIDSRVIAIGKAREENCDITTTSYDTWKVTCNFTVSIPVVNTIKVAE